MVVKICVHGDSATSPIWREAGGNGEDDGLNGLNEYTSNNPVNATNLSGYKDSFVSVIDGFLDIKDEPTG